MLIEHNVKIRESNMRNRLVFLLLVSVIVLLGFHLVRKDEPKPQIVAYERPWFQDTGRSPQYDISCYTNICEVFFASSIDEQSNYIRLAKLLETAPKGSVINFHLSGNGGSTDTVIYLGNAVKLSKATVNTIVDGPVYSAHAYLALLGDTITFGPNVFLMFHSPAVAVKNDKGLFSYISIDHICDIVDSKDLDRGQSSKLKCIEANVYYKQAVYAYLKTFGRGYLSDEEIVKISEGYDVYVSGEQMLKKISK